MNRQLYQPLHTKGKDAENADPSGMQVCVAAPGRHFGSTAVLDEGEGALDGAAAEGDAHFRLRS